MSDFRDYRDLMAGIDYDVQRSLPAILEAARAGRMDGSDYPWGVSASYEQRTTFRTWREAVRRASDWSRTYGPTEITHSPTRSNPLFLVEWHRGSTWVRGWSRFPDPLITSIDDLRQDFPKGVNVQADYAPVYKALAGTESWVRRLGHYDSLKDALIAAADSVESDGVPMHIVEVYAHLYTVFPGQDGQALLRAGRVVLPLRRLLSEEVD